MKRFTQIQVDELNGKITTAEDALRWASENLHPAVAKASSFGAEDSVLIEMMTRVNPEFRFFTLDTGRLPKETHEIMDKLRKKYSMHLQVLCPDTKEVEEMVNAKGQNLFYESTENRILCCKVRKVNPINRLFCPTLDGWITGIRKEHSKNRNSMQMFQIPVIQPSSVGRINGLSDLPCAPYSRVCDSRCSHKTGFGPLRLPSLLLLLYPDTAPAGGRPVSNVKNRNSGFTLVIISINTESSAPKLDAFATAGCRFSDAHLNASSAVVIFPLSSSTCICVNLFMAQVE